MSKMSKAMARGGELERPGMVRAREASRRYWRAMLALAMAALVIRILHVRVLYYSPVSDMLNYVRMADRCFVLPLVADQSDKTILYPPGYPFFLWVLRRWLGLTSLQGMLTAQAIVGALGTIPVVLATREFFGARAGLIAGALYAIYDAFVSSSGLLLTESLAIPGTALLMWLVAVVYRRPSWGRVVAAALVAGLLAHVRTNLLLLGGVVALGVLVSPVRLGARDRWLRVAVFGGLVGLTLVPWSVRNSLVAGRPTFIAANSGMNLAQGNCPLSNGGITGDTGTVRQLWPWLEQQPGERYTDYLTRLGKEGSDFIRRYPFYELYYLLPKRAEKLFSALNVQLWWDLYGSGTFQDFPFGPRVFVPLLSWPMLSGLGVCGLLLAKSRLPRFLLLAMAAALVAPLLMVHIVPRFRYPFDVLMVMLAAGVMARLVDRAKFEMVVKRLVVGYAAVVCVGTLAWASALSGFDWLGQERLVKKRSPLAAGMQSPTGETFSRPVGTTPLFEVRVSPGLAPHLLLSYDFQIEVRDPILKGSFLHPSFQGPDVSARFFTEDDRPVTWPPAGGPTLVGRHYLHLYQETTSTAWRVLFVPALARKMVLSFTNDIEGTVTVANMRLRGPVWVLPPRGRSVAGPASSEAELGP